MIARLAAALRHPAAAADTVVIALGCWAIYSTPAVYLGWTFEQLVSRAWIALLCFTTAWVMLLSRASRATEPGPAVSRGRLPRAGAVPIVTVVTLAAAAGLCVSWRLGVTPYSLFGIAGLSHLGAVVLLNREQIKTPAPAIRVAVTKRDLAALLVVAVAAVLVTSIATRPDFDDAYYVNVVVDALDRPERPLLTWDGMHGEEGIPINQVIHRPQTFELLIGLLARTSGMTADVAYYALFPTLFALLFPVAQWLLCRQIDARLAWLSVMLAFVVMLSWGDGHRAYGNFGFVRLFQGKGSFVSVFVPLITYYGIAFSRTPHWRLFALLSLAQCAAFSVTSSALVMAPICTGLALVGGAPLSRTGLKRIATGALSCLPLLGTLVLVQLDVARDGGLTDHGPLLDIAIVWGKSWRAPIALLMVIALPLVALRAGLPSARWLCRYMFVGFLFVLSGFGSWLSSVAVADLFSWRIAWVFPAPTLVAATAAAGLAYGGHAATARPAALWSGRVAAASLLLLFVVVGGHTLAPRNQVQLSLSWHKHPEPELEAARAAARLTPPDGLVLAPMRVATVIPRLHHSPRLVAVRGLYLTNLVRYWGRQESRDRLRLMAAIGGAMRTKPQLRWFLEEIARRGVTTIVCRARISVRLGLARRLRARGYSRAHAGGYVIWYRV